MFQVRTGKYLAKKTKKTKNQRLLSLLSLDITNGPWHYASLNPDESQITLLIAHWEDHHLAIGIKQHDTYQPSPYWMKYGIQNALFPFTYTLSSQYLQQVCLNSWGGEIHMKKKDDFSQSSFEHSYNTELIFVLQKSN